MRLGPDWDEKNTINDTAAAWIDGRDDVGPGETARVTLKAGEYFVSNGCLLWRYVGGAAS
jgi:hypothetical protein